MHFRPPNEQNDHKVTCGVNVGVLQKVLDQLQGSLDKARVQANIIVSGTGGDAAVLCCELLFWLSLKCACCRRCWTSCRARWIQREYRPTSSSAVQVGVRRLLLLLHELVV
jgi:hypothetical protein